MIYRNQVGFSMKELVVAKTNQTETFVKLIEVISLLSLLQFVTASSQGRLPTLHLAPSPEKGFNRVLQ